MIVDARKLSRILEELDKAGCLEELKRQLDLNLTLEQRRQELEDCNAALTKTTASRQDHIEQVLEWDRRVQEDHERQISKMAEERAQNARIIGTQKNEISDLTAQKNSLQVEIAAGKWFIAPLHRNPGTLRTLQPFIGTMLNYPQELDPATLDFVFHLLMKSAEKEFTNLGRLVPREELNAERSKRIDAEHRASDRDLILGRLQAITKFVRDPSEMSTEQKRMFLEAYAQTGSNSHQGFVELMKRVAGSETCPIHGTVMVFDFPKLRWECPTLNCTFNR